MFRYGKYKGYTLVDVELIDPGYVRWARQNAPNLIPKPPQKQLVDEDGDVVYSQTLQKHTNYKPRGCLLVLLEKKF